MGDHNGYRNDYDEEQARIWESDQFVPGRDDELPDEEPSCVEVHNKLFETEAVTNPRKG